MIALIFSLFDRIGTVGHQHHRDPRAGQLVAAVIVGRPRAVPELRDRLSYLTEGMSV